MIDALEKNRTPSPEHLERCDSCRTEFELMHMIGAPDSPPMAIPSDDAINRYALIPLLSEGPKSREVASGAVVFDSWSERPAAELRDVPDGLVRRICLEAGDIRLELVAERHQGVWDLAARVYENAKVSLGFVLTAGRRRLLPQHLGFYTWTSKSVPRRISLQSDSRQIGFDTIQW